jgi:hypothetical protein
MIRRIAAAATAAVLLATPAIAPAYAIDTIQAPTVDAVLQNLAARMDAVSSYQAHVAVAIHLHTFPFLAANLDGTTSYARPGRYTVTFNSLPSLASAFQKVSGDIGDPAGWRDKYTVALDPDSASAGPNTLVLRLTEKVRGQIDHALAYVDLGSSTVSQMDWFYYSGGRITMQQHFAPVDGVLLVDKQAANIDMPGYKATAEATFDGYTVQVNMAPNTRAAKH